MIVISYSFYKYKWNSYAQCLLFLGSVIWKGDNRPDMHCEYRMLVVLIFYFSYLHSSSFSIHIVFNVFLSSKWLNMLLMYDQIWNRYGRALLYIFLFWMLQDKVDRYEVNKRKVSLDISVYLKCDYSQGVYC